MKHRLNPFERWMVTQNVAYAKTEGVAPVVDRLKAQGYHKVAAAVAAAPVAAAVPQTR